MSSADKFVCEWTMCAHCGVHQITPEALNILLEMIHKGVVIKSSVDKDTLGKCSECNI